MDVWNRRHPSAMGGMMLVYPTGSLLPAPHLSSFWMTTLLTDLIEDRRLVEMINLDMRIYLEVIPTTSTRRSTWRLGCTMENQMWT